MTKHCSLRNSGESMHMDFGMSKRIAQMITSFAEPANTDQKKYLLDKAYLIAQSPYESDSCSNPIWENVYKLVENNIHRYWVDEIRPHEVLKGMDWENFICSYPADQYSILAEKFVRTNNLLEDKTILEVGSGVGGLARLLVKDSFNYIRTDLKLKFMSNDYGCQTEELDILQKSDKRVDIVIGVNVFHCVKDGDTAVRNMYDCVNPGGYLIIGEGIGDPIGCGAWFGDMILGLFNGWWDTGGYREKDYWLNIMKSLDHSEYGVCPYYEGDFLMGGLYWIKK